NLLLLFLREYRTLAAAAGSYLPIIHHWQHLPWFPGYFSGDPGGKRAITKKERLISQAPFDIWYLVCLRQFINELRQLGLIVGSFFLVDDILFCQTCKHGNHDR